MQQRPITSDQRLLLSSRPSFDLALARHGCQTIVDMFGMNKRDWEASGRVPTTAADEVSYHPNLQIMRVADIQRIVGAARM